MRSAPISASSDGGSRLPRLIFVEHDGARIVWEARNGDTVMRAARAAGVAGIAGECGGCMNCLTCHCYVSEDAARHIPPPAQAELDMMDSIALVRSDSRLACQIVVTQELDGARFDLPEWQG